MKSIGKAICESIGITGKTRRTRGQSIQDRRIEMEISMRTKAKMAGEKMEACLQRIINTQECPDISEQVKENKI